jgi:hypothetical protein
VSEDVPEYLAEGAANPGKPRSYIPPDPGTGTVYVGPPDKDGVWKVSWQGRGSRFASAWGSEGAVIAWAMAQPAERRLICRHEGGNELIWAELAEPK